MYANDIRFDKHLKIKKLYNRTDDDVECGWSNSLQSVRSFPVFLMEADEAMLLLLMIMTSLVLLSSTDHFSRSF